MPTEYNPQLVDNMSAKFRRLNNPAPAMADAIGMLRMFPGLVGLWPGSAVGASGQLLDMSGNGLNLSNTGNAALNNAGLAPFASYNGSSNYHSIASTGILNITGTESHINGAIRGLTIGAWIYVRDAAPAAHEYVTGKGGDTYQIRHATSSNVLLFRANGAGPTPVTVGTTVPTANNWYFVCGRFVPSTKISIKVNSADFEDNTTSIPASLNTDSTGFAIGADAGGTNFFDGRVCLSFLCAAAVSDIHLDTYFQMTAPLFGVDV